MKVYWDKTAVIGLVGFMLSLLLILCFMDRLSYPLVGIFLCLFGILFCGIYGALLKAGSPGRQKKKYLCLLLAFLPGGQHSQSCHRTHIYLNRQRRSQLYLCSHLGVSFTAFLLGSWWKTTNIASKADWSDWGWL